jgi:hypothetical protein
MSIVKTGVFVIVAALLVYGGHWYNTKADMKVKEETIQRQQQDAVREKEVLSKLIKDEVESVRSWQEEETGNRPRRIPEHRERARGARRALVITGDSWGRRIRGDAHENQRMRGY